MGNSGAGSSEGMMVRRSLLAFVGDDGTILGASGRGAELAVLLRAALNAAISTDSASSAALELVGVTRSPALADAALISASRRLSCWLVLVGPLDRAVEERRHAASVAIAIRVWTADIMLLEGYY